MSTIVPERSTVLHPGVVDASAPPGRDEEQGRRITSQMLIGVSLLVTWFLVYLFVLSGLEQGQVQAGLYSRLRTELAEGTAPTGAPIEPGRPVALLSIPGIDVEDVVVVEGSRPGQLQDGPGHVLGSVLPGQQGLSQVAGRSLSFGAPFARIDELPVGAAVEVTTAQGEFTYRVLGSRTEGDPLPPAPAAGASRLTLVTASRGTGLGGLQPQETVYVDAALDEGAVVAGQVALKDTGVTLMSARADTTTLALLALALQVLVATLAGFAWAWSSWSRPAAWLAGGPCVLAALWLVSSLASRLLPALI
ncbi:sortase domain-bontaining protein [Nocardioides lianchengensis]|uniref:Sortase A n=1 Tax=Nocardioides lianchengensis TaxID=1045774 RepID=A0A1G6TKC1_9ACTN|nr:sortase [Nocardioides lianchengensis]NYG11741.1 sortase A [Nocardioides lianchengensis]SDD28956.1 sortase A [Nocardioides lianchengensis]